MMLPWMDEENDLHKELQKLDQKQYQTTKYETTEQVSHYHHKRPQHGFVYLLNRSIMKVPHWADTWNSINHVGYENLVSPKCVENEVIKNNDAAVKLPCYLCENFSSRIELRGAQSVYHGTNGCHPEKVHHNCHHEDDD